MTITTPQSAAQEINRMYRDWCISKGYTAPIADDEIHAVRRNIIRASFGYVETAKDIEHELTITRKANARRNAVA